MPAAWYPTRWSNWCFPEDEKKGVQPIFTGKVLKVSQMLLLCVDNTQFERSRAFW